MVYQVQKEVLADLTERLEQLSFATYFSDGCAGQYKNCKNLYNLCHHKVDFNVDAKWVFFATSHGKQPCDGIGGTVKRLVSKASLQLVNKTSILNPHDMFEYCQNYIKGIKFIFISKDVLVQTRESLVERFTKAVTIPGTRSYHEFIPISKNSISMKYCSEDKEVATTFSFSGENPTNTELWKSVKSLDFVSCYYEEHWWIGLVLEKDEEQEDLRIKFMHPHGPSPSFVWPSTEDLCWVLYNHILCKIDSPITTTGRSYTISETDMVAIRTKVVK